MVGLLVTKATALLPWIIGIGSKLYVFFLAPKKQSAICWLPKPLMINHVISNTCTNER